MKIKDKIMVHSMAELVVPEWYRQAKAAGDDEAALRAKIRQFLAEALQRRAQKQGKATPDAVAEEVVTITYDMYEHALTLSHTA